MAAIATERLAGRAGTPRYAGEERVALRRLLWVGPLAVAAATAANEVARQLMVAALPISPDFLPMQAQGVAMMTVLFTIAAVAVFAATARLTLQPIRTFQIVSAVTLVVSLFPDLMLLSDPTATVAAVVALMVLHAVAAVAVVWPISVLTREA